MAKRRIPTLGIQADIINKQTGRCGYCNASLVDQIIQWDHYIPFAYLHSNPDDNWVAACLPCNQYKQDLHLASEADLTAFCLKMLKLHGSLGEGWPDGSTTAFRHLLGANS